ncbi:hypothetical protein NCH01_30680 [Neoasaia chiangmaiensis]|nr:hypothetical protein NCH01_30680 [Neoasaia chiangmaiensis]
MVEAQLISVDTAIEALIASDTVLARRQQVLAQRPKPGGRHDHALMADMPELGAMEEG